MRLILAAALAGLGAAFTPAAAQTADDPVVFSEAMACSSLFTLLADASQDEPEYDELVDVAARWLVIATRRDGRENVVPQIELEDWVSSLLGELEVQESDEAREAFLFAGIDECEANYQLIAEEFDAIETN